MSYYASGLFKAKSTTILNEQELESLIHTSDERFFELLRNYGFGINESVEVLYENEVKKLKEELFNALGDKEELKVFFYPYDILNTKLIYKELKEGIKAEDFYLNIGNIKIDYIKDALKNKEYKDLDDDKDIFIKINQINEPDYLLINYQIDELFINKMKDIVKGSEPLTDYLTYKLDLTNILSVIRVKALNLNKEILNDVVHPTENLTKVKLLNLYDKSFDEIEKYMTSLGYHGASRSINKYKRDLNLENLEANFELNLYELLIDYSFLSTGIGYIMSYIYLKLMELKNIKIVYYNRNTSLDKLFIPEL